MKPIDSEARLAQLRQMLLEDPNDPFLLYAMATEYQPIDIKKALTYFEQLLEQHEDYIPTYYQAAYIYRALAEEKLAKNTFEKGIAKAREQQEHKTLQELQNAYQNYLFEIEED